MKTAEILIPILLALGGAGLGAELEYGAHGENKHPHFGGKALFGIAIGGLVIGSAFSLAAVWSRKRAQDSFVLDCLKQRGYAFSE